MRWLLANSTKILYRDRSTERELYTSSRAWIYWMQASVRGEERERLLIGRTGLRGEMRYLSLHPVFEYNKMDWFRDLRCNFNYNYRRSTGNIEKVELKRGNFGDRSAWFKLFYPIVRGSKRYIIRGGSSRWLIESFVEFETIRQSIIDVLHTCIYHPNIPKQAPLLIPYPRFAVVAANNSKNVPPHRMKKKERERWRRKGKEGEEEEKLLSRQSWANISMRRNRASGQGSHFTSYLCGWIKLYTDLGRLCLSLLSFFSTVSFFIFYFFLVVSPSSFSLPSPFFVTLNPSHTGFSLASTYWRYCANSTAAPGSDEYIVDSATIYATVPPDHISIANYSAPADKHSIKVHSYK